MVRKKIKFASSTLKAMVRSIVSSPSQQDRPMKTITYSLPCPYTLDHDTLDDVLCNTDLGVIDQHLARLAALKFLCAIHKRLTVSSCDRTEPMTDAFAFPRANDDNGLYVMVKKNGEDWQLELQDWELMALVRQLDKVVDCLRVDIESKRPEENTSLTNVFDRHSLDEWLRRFVPDELGWKAHAQADQLGVRLAHDQARSDEARSVRPRF